MKRQSSLVCAAVGCGFNQPCHCLPAYPACLQLDEDEIKAAYRKLAMQLQLEPPFVLLVLNSARY